MAADDGKQAVRLVRERAGKFGVRQNRIGIIGFSAGGIVSTDAVFGPGALDRAGRRPGSHIPFSADAKKALELSLREAIRLKERSIRSGHLLLGILRAGSPGRALLENAGVDADALRQALEQEMRAA